MDAIAEIKGRLLPGDLHVCTCLAREGPPSEVRPRRTNKGKLKNRLPRWVGVKS
ncbi:hypothetical protein HY213_00220 [Candidatus Peregrinibacteria bacterium]|nr:hypothetical protein [Candidatus Peregrinibacteria bacterium]